jgi:hypothetical protein
MPFVVSFGRGGLSLVHPHCCPLLAVVMVFVSSSWSTVVVVVVHHCCGRPSSPPHHIVIVCPSPSSLCGHCRCRVALSLPNVAEGEAVTWQWLAGVTMVAGWVMAFRKKKVGLTA